MSKNFEAFRALMGRDPTRNEWLDTRPTFNVEIQTAIELVNALATEQRKQFDHLAGVLREMREEQRRYNISLGEKLGEWSVDIELISRALAAVKPAPTVGPGKKLKHLRSKPRGA